MDITFYALVVLACIILMLAMWACSAGGVNKWGPDLTLELPVDVIRDALYPPTTTVQSETEKRQMTEEIVPSAPTEFLHEPLLMHAQPMGLSEPAPNFKQPTVFNNPQRNFKQPVELNISSSNFKQPVGSNRSSSNIKRPAPPPPFLNSQAVRVLPTNFTPNQKLRPPMYNFTLEKPV